MNTSEIVRELRCVQEKHRNDRLLTFQTNVSAMARDAADMIESLQARLVEYDVLAAEYGIDGKAMLTLAKSQIKTAQDNIKLREQLAERDKEIERRGMKLLYRVGWIIVFISSLVLFALSIASIFGIDCFNAFVKLGISTLLLVQALTSGGGTE